MEKKLPKFIDVDFRPIIVVGEKMGKQRDGEDLFALEGNNTGDFVHEAIGDKKNIILTNLVNYYYPEVFRADYMLTEGLYDLQNLIDTWEPVKIITLGSYAEQYVKVLRVPVDCIIFSMPHPSYIRRFHNKKLKDYLNILSDELNKRVSINP